jgi:uncharacterized protein (DUF427 family)
MKAIFNNTIIAESDDIVTVEGTPYFPLSSVNMDYLSANGNKYQCSWKGECDYFDVKVGDITERDGAWVYPDTSEKAKNIEGFFAFQGKVEVTE